ncbi:hypothetical protein FM104_00545 [Microbacterium esteraromaticum]|uniref:DUF1697 domain-containing protein n=1 Tax=Microbacterium esteraromaticum TaxID=57043 RepID=A0A1R4I8X5_9MICO|nr:hypothetical protein FM104_00545 [Microbacterium esteraromaticum]
MLLLRAVNVGGANRVPMAELRMLLGDRTALTGVSTYIASGNILCDLPDDRAALCAEVRALISERFGVDTPVILRTHSQLSILAGQNPFPDAPLDKMVHVMFLDGDASPQAVDQLTERLQPGERIALLGRDLWIDYGAGGVAGTKLTKSVLDRALGVAGTARNLRTVRTLTELTAPG